MGMLNRIVNVVILILAVTAVVFAFLLFRKREVLMERGDRLAKAVQEISSELDSTSGTNIASNLDRERDLGHKAYPALEDLSKLNDKLGKAKQQAQDVKTQRDSLGLTLKDTAGIFNLPDFRPEDFQKMDQYAEKSKLFSAEIAKIKDRADKVVAEVVASGDKLGITITPASLNDNGTYQESLDKFNTKVEDVKKRHDNYSEHIASIAQTLELTPPDFSGADYSSSLDTHMQSVQDHKRDFEQTKTDLASAKDKIKVLQTDLAKAEEQIAGLQRENADIAKQKDNLQAQLDKLLGKNVAGGKQEDDEQAMRKYVQAKIVDVNKKWDFVVIDYGTKGKVTIPSTNTEVSFPLPPAGELTVATGFDGDQSKFIGRLQIVKVYDNCAICNVLPDPKGGQVSVGDVVYFAN